MVIINNGNTSAAASEPVTTVRELVEYMEEGCKPEAKWRIGTEYEKFGFRLSNTAPLTYDGPQGIRRVLEAMTRFGWQPVYEDDHPIALTLGHQSITLEPGGQFELSGAPLQSVHETCDEMHEHLRQVREVSAELDIGFLGLGFRPHWPLSDMPWMPKQRYAIMRAYMPKRGKLGHEMMQRTCTAQVNLDFSSEADMVKKFRVSLALQPIATALFANSPFADGKPNGLQSLRSHIWSDTDPDRCGMLPFVFESGMGFERYVEYALDVPMYFVVRNGRYVNLSGQSFRAFLDGRLAALPGERPTRADFTDHLTTIFTEVRLKHFLEMRGADASADTGMLCGVPAFWVGLLYDSTALDEAWQLVRDWTQAERAMLRAQVPCTALRTPLRNTTVQRLAIAALDIAARGLAARARRPGADDETHYLAPLRSIADLGRTQSDALLDLYHGSWEQDIAPIFTACRY